MDAGMCLVTKPAPLLMAPGAFLRQLCYPSTAWGGFFFARLFRAGSVPQLRSLHSPMAVRRGIWGLWGC